MRRSVSLLIVAGVLPVVALGGTFGAITFRNQRDAVEQQARANAAYGANLIAVRMRGNLQAVEMVAQSPVFDGDALDLGRFERLAARIVTHQPDWRTISVADASGNRLIDTPRAIGGPSRVIEMNSYRRALATGLPQIGDVVVGPRSRRSFAIRAPVKKDGRVAFVVSAVVPASRLADLLTLVPLPEGWTASLVDGAGKVIVASEATPMAQGRAVPDVRWAAVPGTGWRVRITTPVHALSRPVRNAVLLLSAAAVLCFLLLVLLTRMLAAELKQVRLREASQLQSQRMEALGRLTGGVAHDFNNLLTPIIGGLDLLGRHAKDEKSLRYIQAALASAERAKALVSRLLSFSRRQSLTPEGVDLRVLLDGMADLIDRSLTPAITLEVDVAPDLCLAYADRGQLELAILNLVINARDAMPDGGTVRIAACPPSASQCNELPARRYICVEVSDTGAGMDAKTIAQAIDPFFTTKPADRGTGLGLSMVHGFAAQSGGAFQLVSELGKGTTASIILPCSDRQAEDAALVSEETSFASGRLLLVDDEESVRRAAAEMLIDAGHRVTEAKGCDHALEILQQDARYDAVITDFIMPNRSGGELIDAIRARWPRMPILLVTGFVSADQDVPRDVAKLMKPFGRDELAGALARLLMSPTGGGQTGVSDQR